ncbi:pre-peptidase [Anoxybacillus vitaminiphilus]|uniref:Pre-peptidase n=1 Tax=Paranoxybacillus vitaminiphilus TaxID=581036 RepID=A0A327YG52_9BACL|nr:S8 family serine peptidase [Anoxybacillus vitaminiphilus]RAK19854.1 pre-peptidase [Anoxybacillus vitaminiphilus]
MGKWKKITAAFGLSATLLMPSFAAAQESSLLQRYGEKPAYDVLERLNLSAREKSKLAFEQKKEEKAKYSEDTLIVKYNKKLSSEDHKRLGTYVIRSFPQLGYEVVKLQKGKKMEDVIKAYQKLDAVSHVAPSVKLEKYGNPDPKKTEMYHLQLLQIEKALKLAGSNEVTVAVIDGLVDVNHPELKGRVLPPYNVADPANLGYPDYHGTHVAGIIASEMNNGIGGHGVAPNAKILPIDVFGRYGGFDYILAEAILYAAENGADVINMSLGAPFEMPLVEEAIKKAVEKGVVIVAAAGNDGAIQYNYPASYDGVITVGATNDKNKKAYFTTYGPSIDVVAPGEDVYSTLNNAGKSTFYKLSGTSMASPIVAGVAALIKSKYPNLNTYEVEYILENTAVDLGEKGFDLDYGYGLVNPEAALKYDIKNLPKFKNETDEEILKAAASLEVADEPFVHTGQLTTPRQTDWVKLDVAEGEYIQTTLSGADKYDYKMVLRFYPEGETKSDKPIEVRNVRQGKTEAKLWKAPAKGTLVIGVTDENENYSVQGLSKYELTVQRFAAPSEDIGTKEEPIEITELPFDSNTLDVPLQLLSENKVTGQDGKTTIEDDKDYFKLKVEEPAKIQINLSAIPGLNTSLKLYFAEEFYTEPPADLPEYEKGQWPLPMTIADRNGVGEKEMLTLEAAPGEYILEVDGEGSSYFDLLWYLFYGLGMDNQNQEENELVKGSMLPYQLTVETKELPEDEDGYPVMEPPMEEPMEAVTEEAVEKRIESLKKQADQNAIIIIYDEWNEFQKEDVEQIKEKALAYNIGDTAEGYFQSGADQDWFTFNVNQTAIYEFTINQTDTLMPELVLYAYDEKEGTLYQVASSWMFYNPFGLEDNKEIKMQVTLEKDKQYYLQLRSSGEMSFDPYRITSKFYMDAPKDANEDNNEPIRATALNSGSKVRGNFVQQGDIDIFYYKHRAEDQIVGFSLKPLELDEKQKENLPSELTMPLDVVATVIEDTDGNMQISEEEANKLVVYDYGWENEAEAGSFKAKKNAGYFIIVDQFFGIGANISEYELMLNTSYGQDEDAKSVVKNNVPSHPLSFKQDGNNKWKAAAKLNGGVPFGDKDFYRFDAAADGTFKLTLETPKELDGVITVYDAKGNVVKTFDDYMQGDAETGYITLKKGTYYVEVKDVYARSSIDNYQLYVEKTK